MCFFVGVGGVVVEGDGVVVWCVVLLCECCF